MIRFNRVPRYAKPLTNPPDPQIITGASAAHKLPPITSAGAVEAMEVRALNRLNPDLPQREWDRRTVQYDEALDDPTPWLSNQTTQHQPSTPQGRKIYSEDDYDPGMDEEIFDAPMPDALDDEDFQPINRVANVVSRADELPDYEAWDTPLIDTSAYTSPAPSASTVPPPKRHAAILPPPESAPPIPKHTAVSEQLELPLGLGATEQLELPLWNTTGSNADTQIPFNDLIKLPERTLWQSVRKGFDRGLKYGVGDEGHYTKSVFTQRAPSTEYGDLNAAGKAAFAGGRVAGDVLGHGTRKFFWNIHPEDFTYTAAKNQVANVSGAGRVATFALPYATTVGLALGSGNFNPLNIADGGRTDGFAAINPDPEDPRKSTSPVYDLLIERGIKGQRGRLLPWEQFHQERPDVPYERYEAYKKYQWNKEGGPLSTATLGFVKGTDEGLDGTPEAAVMGYRVTPLGALAAGGTLAAGLYGLKRMAKLR